MARLNAESLYARYSELAVVKAGCELLDWPTAMRFLDEVEAERLTLNGIEGYWLRGETIEPSMDNSIYFRGLDIRLEMLPGAGPIAKARAWLEERKESALLFDFDILDDHIHG